MGPAVIPLIPYALAAVGTGVGAYEQNQVASRQNSIEQQSLQEQQDLKNQALGAVNRSLHQVQQSPQDAQLLKQQQQEAYTKQLIANSNAAQTAAGNPPTTGAPALPGASRAYNNAQAGGATTVGNYGRGLSDVMSSIGGVQQNMQSTGAGIQNTANTVSTLQQESAQDSFVKQLQAQGIMENPWIKGAATLAQVAGLGLSSAGLGAAAGTADSTAAGAYTAAGAPIAAGGTDIAPALMSGAAKAARAYSSAGAFV